MGDVAASPNDPIFVNHHAMIDCIFEKWKECNKDEEYPESSIIAEGHKKTDYQVPFLPLYTHEDMFKPASEFGYTCKLDIECPNTENGALSHTCTTLIVLLSITVTVF